MSQELTPVARLAEVRTRIANAEREAAQVGEATQATTLVAVSKTFTADAIRPVIEAGQRVFGENRVQEAEGKWPALKAVFPDIELHLIGPLQSNKAKNAVALFDVIESVDREKIVRAIADEQDRQGRRPRILVQVNTGAEPQKAGCLPDDVAGLVELARTSGLDVRGLMCIPPVEEEPAVHFAFLAKLADDLGLPWRSMGMSGDYETAIAFGATHVRVGSAIFGVRTPPAG